MRSCYIVLVAATALLAMCEAFLPMVGSDKARISQLISSEMVPSVSAGHRLLRTTKTAYTGEEGEDGSEERTWAHIGGFDQTEQEAMRWLEYWLGEKKSVKFVAEQLKIHNLSGEDAIRHINWDALVKYQKMHYRMKTGRQNP